MNSAIILQELEDKLNSINSSLTSKIDTINTNTASTKTTVDNIYSKVDTEVAAIVNNTNVNNSANAGGNLSQKLSWIGNSLIGATNNSGGSATSGTVMAKLNALLNTTRSFSIRSQSVTYNENSSEQLLNISGTGYIYFVSFNISNSMDIVINGNISFSMSGYTGNVSGGSYSTEGTIYRGTSVLPFVNSLKMSYTSSGSRNAEHTFRVLIVTFA